MVVCNACGTIGYWNGKILMNMNGSKHECLKGKRKPFIWGKRIWDYIEDDSEPDPNIERQVRLEGNTWTLYQRGEHFKTLWRDKK